MYLGMTSADSGSRVAEWQAALSEKDMTLTAGVSEGNPHVLMLEPAWMPR